MTDAPYFVADIGATNARFAVVKDDDWRTVVMATGDYADAAQLFQAARQALAVSTIRGCCVAIAGPVVAGQGEITNGVLRFSGRDLADQLGVDVELVNDFHAQAMALPHLKKLRTLGGKPAVSGPRVVLGPGSGLGVGVLLPAGEGWQVLPSEGGHADLAAGTMLELEVLSLLHQQFDRVCWETVLSGPGLVNLYGAVSAVWGSEARIETPEEISSLGLDASDPVCHQTLELFLGWLGAAAGNLALTFCARGGVYVAGGIVPALGDFVLDSPMRRRFEERAGLEDYVRDLPLYIVADDHPGLIGALACLENPARRTEGS
jgi:glucokinase